MNRYRIASCILLLNVFAAQFVSAENELSAVPVTGSTWCRQVFQFRRPVSDVNEAELQFAGEGVVSVYLNGQRLCRQQAINENVLAWDVSSLIRNGRNSLAVAVVSEAASNSKFTATISNGIDPIPVTGQWKVVTVAPPVGWQTTDYNDRDWKAVSPEKWSGAFDNRKKEILTWRKRGKRNRSGNEKLVLLDGDHVVLLGGTFFERAQQFGHLETALNIAAGDARVTFRNLGWSADTVFADSRGIFDSPERGYERMVEHVRAEEPDVIIINYGQNEAMSSAGKEVAGQWFTEQLSRLHRDLSATGAEIAYVTPHPFVDVGGPLPDASRWNGRLEQYASAVREFANSIDAVAIDLFSGFNNSVSAVSTQLSHSSVPLEDVSQHAELQRYQFQKWTDNGMHWNDAGYRIVGNLLAFRALGRSVNPVAITVNAQTQDVAIKFGELRDVAWDTSSGTVTFQYRAESLSPAADSIVVKEAADQQLSVCRVTAGDKLQTLRSAGADSFVLPNYYDRCVDQTIRKNELYFHRWRPQNITYLFGFRKARTGQQRQ